MRNLRIMLILAFASGLFTTPSFANVISFAGYSHDTTTDIVSGDDLEWLRWDVTSNQSIATALGTYAGSGWRLASNAEISSLFNSFSFGIVFDSDENTRQQQQMSFADQNSENEVTNAFISMFGDTYKASGGAPLGTVDEPYELSGALFGEDGDNDGLYNFASISDDYVSNSGFGSVFNFAFATISEDGIPNNLASPLFGVALVRDLPSPGTLWLVLPFLFIFCYRPIGLRPKIGKTLTGCTSPA